ncbi:MAG: DHHW family protein [Clostridium sp.]|uniref:DHHW family protein n=1 Tax=Clostridium sp. TaxID=1506 RepID=UPI003F2FB901
MKKNYLMYAFCIFVGSISIFDIIKPIRDYSNLENRKLKQEVEFSYSSFISGEFSKNYSDYINDQFIFRDGFISLKALNEQALHKLENNGVLIGKNDYLFLKYFEVDNYRKEYNINSILQFAKKRKENITFMIAPNSYELYGEEIKGHPPLINQEKEIQEIYSKVKEIDTIDLVEVFKENKDKLLYYKTDHHWNIDGAYLAYEKFIESNGEKPIDNRNLAIENDEFYGTFYSKAKPIFNKGDRIFYIPVENVEMEISGVKYNSLYDLEALNGRDKYSVYLRGNNPYLKIKNKNLNNRKKLLVIKDSFANSMIPFLINHYEEIHVVDLRLFNGSLEKTLEGIEFNETLILYNFENFCTESNILKIKN